MPRPPQLRKISPATWELPLSCKDIDLVARAVEKAGLGRRAAKLAPVGNIKG